MPFKAVIFARSLAIHIVEVYREELVLVVHILVLAPASKKRSKGYILIYGCGFIRKPGFKLNIDIRVGSTRSLLLLIVNNLIAIL